jgi:hypothetical protein
MQKIDLYAIYMLGVTLKSERASLKESLTGEQNIRSLARIKSMLESFLEGTEEVNLTYTRQEAEKMVTLLDAEIHDPKSVASRIEGHIRSFRYLFKGESQNLNVFAVSQKGTHSILDLLGRADENLSSDVRSRLSPEAASDIIQAGRCLALECHTAVGFHILRAVETLIRAYHAKLTGSTVAPKNRNWGIYIKKLRSGNADPKVTGYLEHIKDHYRNPIVHPEVVLTSDEAFSLFNACLSAITQLDGAIETVP